MSRNSQPQRLTKPLVEAASTTGPDLFIWDADVPGFGIRVRSSGRKTYVIRYRNAHGVSRAFTLGRTCDMSPQQARDAARAAFVSIKAGMDPSEQRSRARDRFSVDDLFDLWIETYATANCKPSSVYQAKSLYRRTIAKRLGTRQAASLTRADVLDLHVALRSGPSVANQAVSLLSSMYRNGVERKLVESNPARDIKWYRQIEKSRVIRPDEIRQLMDALENERFSADFRRLIRLLFLTGARLSEIRDARMEWVDWDARTLNLPDSKTGAKIITLSEPALEIMAERRGHEWLCAGRYGRGHMTHTWSTWRELLRMSGLEETIRIHDIRHSVGSLGHMAGLSQREIAVQLGHKSLRTTERYTKGYRGIERQVADRVASIMSVG